MATPPFTKTACGCLLSFSQRSYLQNAVVPHSLGGFAIESVLVPEANQAGRLTTSPSSQERTTEGAQWSMRVSGTRPFHEAKQEKSACIRRNSQKKPTQPCNGKALPGHTRTQNNILVPDGLKLKRAQLGSSCQEPRRLRKRAWK